jgi:hypothetical protein
MVPAPNAERAAAPALVPDAPLHQERKKLPGFMEAGSNGYRKVQKVQLNRRKKLHSVFRTAAFYIERKRK